jgi:hypothetical protein
MMWFDVQRVSPAASTPWSLTWASVPTYEGEGSAVAESGYARPPPARWTLLQLPDLGFQHERLKPAIRQGSLAVHPWAERRA